MKLEEKIELLTAYAKDKKLVEVYDENTDSWMIKVFDIWDFENGKYRIKSKIEPKFKAGDVGWITPADNKRKTFTEASFTSLISLNYDDMETKAVLDRRILFSLGFQLKE